MSPVAPPSQMADLYRQKVTALAQALKRQNPHGSQGGDERDRANECHSDGEHHGGSRMFFSSPSSGLHGGRCRVRLGVVHPFRIDIDGAVLIPASETNAIWACRTNCDFVSGQQKPPSGPRKSSRPRVRLNPRPWPGARPQFVSDRVQWSVSRPELDSRDKRRGQEVRVDPADAAPMNLARPDERHDVAVRHSRYLHHPFVAAEKLPPAAVVAHQQLPVHELVTGYGVVGQQPVQRRRKRRAVRKEPDPNPTCPRGRSCRRVLGRNGALPAPRRVWLRTAQRSQALVRGAAHQGLQTEPDGVGVGLRPGGCPGLTEETLIDVEGLLHTDNHIYMVLGGSRDCAGRPRGARTTPLRRLIVKSHRTKRSRSTL